MENKKLSAEAKKILKEQYNNDCVTFAIRALQGELESSSDTHYIEEIVTPMVLAIAKERKKYREEEHIKNKVETILYSCYNDNPVLFAEKLLKSQVSAQHVKLIPHIVTKEVMEAAKWRIENNK